MSAPQYSFSTLNRLPHSLPAASHVSRRIRFAGFAAAISLVGAFASGCDSLSAAPTCAEFAEMAPDTGLLTSFNAEQKDAVRSALKAEGFETGVYNESIAQTEIIAYCNIYAGAAGNNKADPITEAIK